MHAKPRNANSRNEMRAKNYIGHARDALCKNRYEMVLQINISHVREALKCVNRYEIRATNQY